MKLKEIIKHLDYQRLENVRNCEIKGISCHSSCIAPGYLFVAIKGEKVDGHSFVKEALAQGARALILEKDLPLDAKVPKILVRDSRLALAAAAASFFQHPAKKLKAIGITGTNGKTTVSYLIERILSCAGLPCGVIGTINYRVGEKQYPALNTTPQADTLQLFLQEMVLAKSKYAIMEVSSHALEQRRVDYIDFSAAIFTNLSPEHLDYHGTVENYFSCKSKLFEKLAPSSWAIVNLDDPYGRQLLKKINCRCLTYGIEHPAAIRAKDLVLGMEKSKFSAVTPGGTLEIESPLIGRHNVYNILAAIAAAFVENINFAHISGGIKSLTQVCGRLQRIDAGQDFLIFIDFAHTDDALRKILQALRQISKKRIILLFGCGGGRDKTKRPRMGEVATKLADFVLITSDNPRGEEPRAIITDILRGISKEKDNYAVVEDRFEAIAQALKRAQKDDIVVIAGKGHESTQVFAQKSIHFNDREVVEQILQPCLPSKRY